MNIRTILATNRRLEEVFLLKAKLYPRYDYTYKFLISNDDNTYLEIMGLMETAYFGRTGLDDRY